MRPPVPAYYVRPPLTTGLRGYCPARPAKCGPTPRRSLDRAACSPPASARTVDVHLSSSGGTHRKNASPYRTRRMHRKTPDCPTAGAHHGGLTHHRVPTRPPAAVAPEARKRAPARRARAACLPGGPGCLPRYGAGPPRHGIAGSHRDASSEACRSHRPSKSSLEASNFHALASNQLRAIRRGPAKLPVHRPPPRRP